MASCWWIRYVVICWELARESDVSFYNIIFPIFYQVLSFGEKHSRVFEHVPISLNLRLFIFTQMKVWWHSWQQALQLV